jgi:hypothetical protein
MAVARRYGKVIEHQDYLVPGFNIPYDAERIHGISRIGDADFVGKFWRNSISH